MNSMHECLQETLTAIAACDAVIDKAIIVKAVQRLKANKRDAKNELISNHIMYSSDKLYELIASLMTVILIHGFHPDHTRIATII